MGLVRRFGRTGWRGMLRGALAMAALVAAGAPFALAEEPQPWQMAMQPAATPVREHIDSLSNELLVITTLIALFVMGLLIYVMVRFNAKRHPVPSKTSHNALIEVIWTVVPVLILVVIAIPSFKLLYYADRTQHAQMTLKVTGHQWYWTYQYPDQGNLTFDSYMIPVDQAVKEHKKRLLDVDNPVVVPVGTNIRVLVTSTDVIHSWFVPSTGVQEYAVIGRVNESWMNFERPGTYYGECNQICGVNHPFMPIEIRAVSKADFDTWVNTAKKKFASNDGQESGGSTVRLAAATAR